MIKSAMILAAGLGKRMRPLTNTLPKPLIPVAGKSMLERAFEHLKKAKVSNIVVNTHYLAPLIVERLETLHPQAVISHEDILLETGGGIKKALPLLGQDPFFTLNGDSVWSGPESLMGMEKRWEGDTMDALLLLIPREKAHGYEGLGDFHMDSQGRLYRPERGENTSDTQRISRIRVGGRAASPMSVVDYVTEGETRRATPPKLESQRVYVYIGVQLLTTQLFQNAPEGPFSMNLLWDEALAKGRLYGHLHGGEWFHISTPQDLEKYEPMIAAIRLSI